MVRKADEDSRFAPPAGGHHGAFPRRCSPSLSRGSAHASSQPESLSRSTPRFVSR